MKCPFCGSSESKVIDKRETDNDESTRRRRECLTCQKRFTTYENVELASLTVIKKEGVRQQFDRRKILSGLIKACEKRKISIQQLEKVADEIEADLRNLGVPEIPSQLVGEKVMEKLKALDDIAYIRFASVYREFTDLTSFEKELKTLLKKKEGAKNV
jgi:transcriptional repressor NrdR